MTESFIQLPKDGTRKRTRTKRAVIGGKEVHQQVIKTSNVIDDIINPATEDGNLQDIKNNTGKIDILLSDLRNAITAPSPNSKTLNDLFIQLGSLLIEIQKKTEPTDTQLISASALPLPTGAACVFYGRNYETFNTFYGRMAQRNRQYPYY